MNPFSQRKYIVTFIIIGAALVMIVRLFFLQVIDDSYKNSADNNSQRRVTQYPARGIIYDRNGKILVYNEAAYDLMVNPPELKSFDTLEFCSILNISREQTILGIRAAKAYSRFKPSIFLKQLSSENYAVLQEKLYKFPGFYVVPRTLRKYPKELAGHVLGYVGEVNDRIIAENDYYQSGDYIGTSGIEKTYEDALKGNKGVNIYLVDVHNTIKGSFQEKRYDVPSVAGNDLISTLDANLQEYGEKLMSTMTGSIVAIEPSTGEILAMISAPTYKPSLLVGRVRSENYQTLLKDSLKPLFNRALMAKYPPGSTFKLIQGLIGLQEHVIVPSTTFGCSMGYNAGRVHVGCHNHASPLALVASIQNSCNAYYCNVFRKIIEDNKFPNVEQSYINWRKHVYSFGYGHKLNSDFPNELDGFVPTQAYYNKYYGSHGWRALTIISLSIGQGELGVTPLQMANMTCIMANRGYYYIPHIVKSGVGQFTQELKFKTPVYTSIDTSYFPLMVNGMELAVNGGPGSTARVAALQNIVVCGKTGTAQNPHGKDHSIFVAFAPKDNPKIAIAVYVENGGFGATWAAPIASLMIEKYLTDTITRPWLEERMINANFVKR